MHAQTMARNKYIYLLVQEKQLELQNHQQKNTLYRRKKIKKGAETCSEKSIFLPCDPLSTPI